MTNLEVLKDFIHKAGAATYAGGGKPEASPERPGFIELVFQEGDWHYRDSYTGNARSRGMEVVRHLGVPVWSSSYGGGMVEGQEYLAPQTFKFLKQCMLAKDPKSTSFRGPDDFEDGDWKYHYNQQGDVEEFVGDEGIFYLGQQVFFHRIIGGLIKT